MTRQELQEKLNEFPAEALVILAKDAEGNHYSPIDDLEPGSYVAESTWDGNFIDGGNPQHEGVIAICLWPVN